MKKLPLEINSRIKILSEHILYLSDSFGNEKSIEDIIPFIMMNKIVYYSDSPIFLYNGVQHPSQTMKVSNPEEFEEILNEKYKEGKVYCIYNLPSTNYVHTFNGILVKGFFVDIEDGFELRDLVDRDITIDKILK